jgi:prevent-host-death family protein
MIVINIAEAKAKLSEYLELAASGQRVLICKRNQPVAELRAVESPRTAPRPIGLAKGRISVPAAFFEPLPDDLMEGFEGVPPGTHSRVAESRPANYSASPRAKRQRSR